MILGEIANFAAYAFAPAILVTPLGALSIIVRYFCKISIYYFWIVWFKMVLSNENGSWNFESRVCYKLIKQLYFLRFWSFFVRVNCCSAVLAHYLLDERLHIFGVVGCVLCLVGSTTIVLHAPHETTVSSVRQVWHFATEPGILIWFLWPFVH